jgi:DNA mismatch endonuclease (patch repair protein)
MQGNRRTDTAPELKLRRALHASGLRYRKDFVVRAGDVRTKADIVFTRRRVAVFVDGCFWHGCPEHGRMPASNRPYWEAKLGRNRERDERITAALAAAGWQVVRIWEHEPIEQAVDLVRAALSASATTV